MIDEGIEWERDRTLWEQVYDVLRKRIEAGTYKPRYPIPSIAHLVQDLGVSRGTVRKALDTLRDQGYINPISGKGTYVLPSERWRGEQ